VSAARIAAIVALACLIATGANAELRRADLTIFGMD
jgi:hypothetical protein